MVSSQLVNTVIHVDDHKVQGLRHYVYQSQEELDVILETKRHLLEFPEAKGCDYGHLRGILQLDWDLIAAFLEILLTKHTTPILMAKKAAI
jgi:hypothetical protein